MLLEEPGQLLSCLRPVEGDDGVADVLLIAQQPACRGLRVRGASHRGDDVLAGPDDVVGPQLAQRRPQA